MSRPTAIRAERRTLSQAVTEEVLDRIRAGEFRPGDRLPTEKGLMEAYGVGRNAARESMQALAAMGLIEIRPGRGATLLSVETSGMDADTVTALLSDEAIENLYEFRRLLEVETAARAAQRATASDIAQIRKALNRWQREVSRHGTGFSPLDDEFHGAIARASHNPLFVTMLEAVRDLVRRAREVANQVPWSVERARSEHQEILAAIEAHDPERAAEAMGTHLDGAIQAILAGLHPAE